ncbi:diacylglycerol kinase family protein [Phenylobacterium sp.]|uniref:diacylglycerol kinase family protein n=1 Tax=Phenylobacterium sp. TaxID=1871053 RepID=UPI002F3EF7B8
MRAGVIRNPRSHANRQVVDGGLSADVLYAAPPTPRILADELVRFAREGVELVVIDGGDGTVREVVSALPAAYGDAAAPLLAALPSGKTNILARDLGVPRGWTVAAALAAAREGADVTVRAPLQVSREGGGAPLSGFVFGAAGFVRAINRSQRLHRAGVFHDAVVAVGLAGAAAGLLMGGRSGVWARGEALSLSLDGGAWRTGDRLVMIATTLQQFPWGLRPFGPVRPGLKVLDVDAPPQQLLRALRLLLWGEAEGWLAAHGYRRGDARRVRLSLPGAFVLDGETYPGGELTLAEGPPLRFLRP